VQTRRLGSQGPEISVIGFGAWEAGLGPEWGEAPPTEQVVAAIRRALDDGIDWIDTAEVYGDGRSEEIVAQAVRGRRDEVLIATKLAPAPEGTGFRPDEVARGCRQSLERLGTDRIDLFQLHWPDDTGVPIEETWGAMADLVDEGLVRHVGVSNFDRRLIERCEAIRHVDSAQQQFSMVTLDEGELIAWCGEVGTGVVTYGPLAFGLLTGAITMETTFSEDDHRANEETWDDLFVPEQRARALAVVEGMRPIAGRLGVTLAQLALAWNVHQPGVTAAIAGSRNPDHVTTNVAAGAIELDAATLAELDVLLPLGPATDETGDRDAARS
jgi:aryl-alcohol dehydrogenase-like predicted oxidoreductase